MPDQHVLDRIDRWLAAGLIDDATAERLRSAEAAESGPQASMSPMGAGLPAAIGSMFGPAPTIPELFAYLGAGFVIVAWHVLVTSWRPIDYGFYGEATPPVDLLRIALEFGVPTLVLAVAGWWLSRRDERSRRAAGVAFAIATVHVYEGFTQGVRSDDYLLASVVAAAGATIAAILFRLRHRALATHAVLLVTVVSLSAATLTWLGQRVFGEVAYGSDGNILDDNVLTRQLLQVAWWLGTALVLGLLARREIGSAGDLGSTPVARVAAARRATLTRLVAGLTAVGGTAIALLAGGYADHGVPTIAGDGVVLGVSALLMVLAARTASIYLYPAALGIILALTSLNATYVAQQTGVGVAFLIEGAILLAGGLFADRLRRQFSRGGPGGTGGTPMAALVPDGSPMGPSEEATITEITPA